MTMPHRTAHSPARLLGELSHQPDGPAWSAIMMELGEDLREAAVRAAGPELADDAVQEAALLLRISSGKFRCPPGADADQAARAWTRSLAAHAALELLRRHTRAAARAWRSLADAPSASGSEMPSPIELAETATLIRNALAELPPDVRSAVAMRHLEECDTATIAIFLDRPEGTVKTLIHRGLKRMRQRLQRHIPNLTGIGLIVLISSLTTAAAAGAEGLSAASRISEKAPQSSPFPPSPNPWKIIAMTTLTAVLLSTVITTIAWQPGAASDAIMPGSPQATTPPVAHPLRSELDAVPDDVFSIHRLDLVELLVAVDQQPATGKQFRAIIDGRLAPIGLHADDVQSIIFCWRPGMMQGDQLVESNGGVITGRGIGERVRTALASGSFPQNGLEVFWDFHLTTGPNQSANIVDWASKNQRPWTFIPLDADHVAFGHGEYLEKSSAAHHGAPAVFRRWLATKTPHVLYQASEIADSTGKLIDWAMLVRGSGAAWEVSARLETQDQAIATLLAPLVKMNPSAMLKMTSGNAKLDADITEALRSNLKGITAEAQGKSVAIHLTIPDADLFLQPFLAN